MKTFAVVLLAFCALSGARAECPNACSGHGRCNNYKMVFSADAYDGETVLAGTDGYDTTQVVKDSCTCYARREGTQVDDSSGQQTSPGLVFAWTGPDCSLRTCPLGIVWGGSPKAANDHTQKAECSGQGLCDRKTGLCQCFDGYTGEGCRRSTCPNDCSGHGVCQSQFQFADDVSNVDSTNAGNHLDWLDNAHHVEYRTAWDNDKSFGCKCDAGFRGPDCSLIECLSGADPLAGQGAFRGRDCSGRGICDYKTGLCECFTGYRGARCENQDIYA